MSAKKLTMPTIRTNRRANLAASWTSDFMSSWFYENPTSGKGGQKWGTHRRSDLFLLHVVEQRHEAEIHVELLVAMEKRQTGIVRDEVDLCFLIAAEHDHVLENSGG